MGRDRKLQNDVWKDGVPRGESDRVIVAARPGNAGGAKRPDLRHVCVSGRLSRMLRGWTSYFSYGKRIPAYRAVDNYVYQ